MTQTQNEKKLMSIKGLDHYLGLNYPMEILEDEGSFVASIPDLPGCFTYGETIEEAIANLQATKRLWLKGAIESGQTVPEPTGIEDFSGKFVLRIPRALHRSLDREAKKQGVSLNHYLVHLLSERHSILALDQRLETLLSFTATVIQAAEPDPGWSWFEDADPGCIDVPRLKHSIRFVHDVFGPSKQRGLVVAKTLSGMKESFN
jgi:antitoxin HicB